MQQGGLYSNIFILSIKFMIYLLWYISRESKILSRETYYRMKFILGTKKLSDGYKDITFLRHPRTLILIRTYCMIELIFTSYLYISRRYFIALELLTLTLSQ